MAIRTVSLWQEQAPIPPTLGAEEIPNQVDVAIIGGGYTGLGAARLLAYNGARVAVLERHQIGWGASSRNGGKALVGLKHQASLLAKQFGIERARQLWECSRAGIRAIEKIATEESIDCDFEQNGSLLLASKPKHFDAMRRESDWLARHFEYEQTHVLRADLRQEIGSETYFGAVIDSESAGIHPAKWVIGLAEAAKRAGATLCAHTEVLAVEPGANRHIVRTNQGIVHAKDVLVATNGYTTGILSGLRRRIVPIGSYIITTEPLSKELQQELSPRRRMFYDSKWFLSYFRLTPDGRMFFGGRTTISPNQNLHKSASKLQNEMLKVFPILSDTPLTHSWSGQLGLTFDALPHIGRINGIWYALGYCGHGVAMSIYLAQQVADLISGRCKMSLFEEISHPTRVFYRGRPWFRPFLGAGLRMLDLFS